jgi:hypothetical protein
MIPKAVEPKHHENLCLEDREKWARCGRFGEAGIWNLEKEDGYISGSE